MILEESLVGSPLVQIVWQRLQVQWGERESGRDDTCCLACLFCSLCRLSLFVPSFFPPCRPYAGVFFRVFVLCRPCGSSMSVHLQHVCCSSSSLSDLLASQSSQLLSAFFVFFVLVFLFFLVWLVLLCSCFHLPYSYLN